jgi:hypothetical protein
VHGTLWMGQAHVRTRWTTPTPQMLRFVHLSPICMTKMTHHRLCTSRHYGGEDGGSGTQSTLFLLCEVQVEVEVQVIMEGEDEGQGQEGEYKDEGGWVHGSELNNHAMCCFCLTCNEKNSTCRGKTTTVILY